MEVTYLEKEIVEMLMKVIDEHKDELKKGTEVLIKEVVKHLIRRAFESFGNQKKHKGR
jgi:hypothetical protein